MAEFDKELQVIKSSRDEIITRWCSLLTEAFPDFYGSEELRRQAEYYFDFTVDLHIPVETHELNERVPLWSRNLVDRGLPLHHIFRSTSYWRAAVFDVLENKIEPEIPNPIPFLAVIIRRIEYIQEMVCSHYIERTSSRLKDKERALTQLHDDRLSLIGKMAASMAHEIRNPLTSIKGFLKLIRESLSAQESSDKTIRYLSVVENEFENINMQITGFLSFSKKRVIEEPVIRLTAKQLLDSVISLLNPRFLSENVNLVIDLEDDADLYIQKVAVQQVLSNVINNGLDAMEEVKYEKEMHICGYSRPGCYILEIANNGPEVNPRILDELFEPFVTDKEEGTGLGLAVCKTIMQKNGGEIGCVTGPKRTTFLLTFRTHSVEG
ncbi:two-component system sensor histidine kinase NtrB [Paenibacillus mucilaginosus]|uniref:histidine kinase n=1 Tax=Paenibacillus mucilaginosus (strain KNP414) TaxID=1036673 RepID=F8FCQ9_PAEMK|nr:ATP-binding protein [Paenibacillus mucilaginosus]AEI39631.1 probable two-component sensor histidine kinase [Paenibacillus mucilaginosus KNP414]MCG7217727.1 ATP-binding protein [Paenibacillus mucilaginosus]WDM28946.1 GHKL domain-containing protein [Paenibacillus mucilaginosus]